MKRLVWFSGTVVVAAVVLGGCSRRTDPEPAPPGGGAARALAIGMLVGTSPVDHSLDQAQLWDADAKLVAEVAGRSASHVVIDRFGSGPGTSDVMYNARVTSTTGQNSLIRNTQLEQAEKALVRAFGKEQATTTAGPTNLISGVRVMAEHLDSFRHAGTTDVLIFGNAVQTAPPVNLADPVQLADPRKTLQTVASQGLLSPRSCSGWRVYMIDGSQSPAGGLSLLQDEQLREFWRELFASCGGRLVLWDPTLIAFPATGQVPQASWTVPGRRRIIVPLPASVLFQPNSPVLLPSARPVLGTLARMLTRAYPAATATIAGYTAAVGSGPESVALDLSRARAQAVAAYLEGSGVQTSRLSVHGYGDQHQIATDATTAGQALNRRVVITLHLG